MMQTLEGLPATESKVMAVLEPSPRPLRRTEIMERSGLADKTVRNALLVLAARNLVTVSNEGQTKLYAAAPTHPGTAPEPTPVLPEPAATPVSDKMLLAQLQNAVIDAWCKGAGMPRPPQSVRGPMYDTAASIGIAIQKGAYSLDDVTALTREKTADPYTRKRTGTWSLSVIGRELYAWTQEKARRQKYIAPPADFQSGRDPDTGLHRIWDHRRGCVVEVEMAPTHVPQRRAPAPVAQTRPVMEGVYGERFRQDHGRETFSMQHYMVPSRTIITVDDEEE
jgi:hypothetical protein